MTIGPRVQRPWRLAAGVLAGALLVAGAGTTYDYEPYGAGTPDARAEEDRPDPARRRLASRIRRAAPSGRYIVIDQTNNRLQVRQGDRILVDAVCSAGSGMVLVDRAGGREWTFDTPRGRFQVLSRLEDPVWRKPDWAFIEEGKPVPATVGERFERGVLGEYALYFGDGFMIHGTLYERLLGRSVTHGCIRLGRDDLRRVWSLAPNGTPIYIY